uniref:Uncharacterized protein n=1 Tax=Cacopsylla melanoneura TaxID=428564 RepID=A0A8D9FB63_9HEMI
MCHIFLDIITPHLSFGLPLDLFILKCATSFSTLSLLILVLVFLLIFFLSSLLPILGIRCSFIIATCPVYFEKLFFYSENDVLQQKFQKTQMFYNNKKTWMVPI